MTNLHGNAAIVTGAASGMGLAIALTSAEAGASVLATDINEDGLKQFRDHPRIQAHKVNMMEPEAVVAMVETAAAAFGSVDILVNNDGIMDVYQGVASLDLDLWRRTFAVNVDGPMYALRHAVPMMLKKGLHHR